MEAISRVPHISLLRCGFHKTQPLPSAPKDSRSMTNRLRLTLLALSLVFTTGLAHAATAKPDHWVGTWAASPTQAANKEGGPGTTDITLREIVHVSLGGPYARVILTNEFGTEPLKIGAVHVALADTGSAIQLSTANAITFGGLPTITIPPGGRAVSAGVSLTLPPLSNLAVSIYLPAQTITKVTRHSFADQTNYIAEGNAVSKASLDGAKEFTSFDFLKGIDVRVPDADAAIVTLGDSITDGAASTRNANNRWPDELARQLHASKKTEGLAVLNQGIGGNRILHEGSGPSAISRFDRDVIAQAGVKYVILLESINDIGHAYDSKKPFDVITADDLIQGIKQMVDRAHTHNIKFIGGTITGYVGAGYSSPAGEQVRQAVNEWIRTSPMLDGVIDFDKIVGDPAKPGVMADAYQSGDHLHPKDAGYKAMGDGIDLKLFTNKK
jgi:lysophospholipase L1-like esterase